MAKYRVYAKMTTICYLDVEAENEDHAKEIAGETDGGEFISTDEGSWEIEPNVKLIEENHDSFLSIEDESILEEMEKDTNGFGNGHCDFMITGVPEKDLSLVIQLINKIPPDETVGDKFHILCNLSIKKEANDDYTLWFSTHNKYLPEETIKYISSQIEAVCYGANAWDNQANIVRYENGSESEFSADNVMISELSFNENSENSDFYYDIEVKIKCTKTDSVFIVGGGCICQETVIDLCNRLGLNFAQIKRNLIWRDLKAAFNSVEYGFKLSGAIEWSISNKELKQLAILYRDDAAYRTKILDLLEDCNFHTEYSDFENGDYEKYID